MCLCVCVCVCVCTVQTSSEGGGGTETDMDPVTLPTADNEQDGFILVDLKHIVSSTNIAFI